MEPEVLRDWIEACQNVRQRLTKWEQEFVDSVSGKLESDGNLTVKQVTILERIYANRT
jgi:hypothetical protein